jgi:hypothetical protein
MGRGKERKMDGRSATADQVKDLRKRLKQKLFQTESPTKKYFFKKALRPTYAEYLGLLVISKHTLYAHVCSGEQVTFIIK